jgi:hypothetical protein
MRFRVGSSLDHNTVRPYTPPEDVVKKALKTTVNRTLRKEWDRVETNESILEINRSV